MPLLKKQSLFLLLMLIFISAFTQSVSAQILGNKSGGSDVQKSVDALQAAMMDLQRQFEQVQAEKAQLRGQVEALQKQSEDLQTTQKLYFKDVDSRLTRVEPQKVEIEGVAGELVPGEKLAYEVALKSFQEGQFDKADAQFSAFVQKYPASPYLPLALYWLGNSKYALKDYSGATIQFEKLIALYPSHQRVPSAMLMMANCQLESGNKLVANLLWTNLVNKYPTSAATVEARASLGVAPQALPAATVEARAPLEVAPQAPPAATVEARAPLEVAPQAPSAEK